MPQSLGSGALDSPTSFTNLDNFSQPLTGAAPGDGNGIAGLEPGSGGGWYTGDSNTSGGAIDMGYTPPSLGATAPGDIGTGTPSNLPGSSIMPDIPVQLSPEAPQPPVASSGPTPAPDQFLALANSTDQLQGRTSSPQNVGPSLNPNDITNWGGVDTSNSLGYGSLGFGSYSGGYGSLGYGSAAFGYGSLGFGSFGGGSFGGFGGYPVVLDLAGKGIKVTPLSSSNMFVQSGESGYSHRSAWAGAGNGVLVYDPSGGAITQASQYEFTLWDPAARNDMQALADVFDSNHDGVLNASDASWSSFRILVTNADGTTTLETLAQAGVTSINLRANAYSQTLPDGSSIDGETTFTRSNGTTGTAAAVTFADDGGHYKVQQTVTHNADGSTTLANAAYNPDGSLNEQIITVTSANGLNKTINFDWNGDGVVDQIQTDNIVVNGDGSKTETLADVNASGVLLDKTTTTTSADGKTVTINRDTTGSGYTAQRETDITNADGGTSVTTLDFNRDGSAIDWTVSNVSADGLTRSFYVNANADNVWDLITVDQTIVGADGTRTETVTDTNSDGSKRDQTVTTTSANGLNVTTKTDSAGTGVFNLVSTSATVNNSDGSTTTTQTNSAANGAKLDQVVTIVGANGQTTTTRTDAAGTGVLNATEVDSLVLDASGNRTKTITYASSNGGIYEKLVAVLNADGKTGSKQTYANLGFGLALTRNETKALNGSGALVDAIASYAPNGAKTAETVTTSSADGLTTWTQVDPSGGGVFDFTTTSQTAKNSDGSSLVAETETANNGSKIHGTLTWTSANGLDVWTHVDNTGNGTFDQTTHSATANNSDGSESRTIIQTSANGTNEAAQVVNISADRSTVTTITDAVYNGQWAIARTDAVATTPNGTTTETVINRAPNGALINETVTTTSANGLSKTVYTDANGAAGVFNLTMTDNIVLNANGGRTETVTDKSANGGQIDQTVTTTSANGLSRTTQTNVDGKIDYMITDNTAFDSAGNRSETVTKQSANGAKISSTTTAASGNGLSVTTVVDENGDGVVDLTRWEVTVLNADGGKTQAVTEINGANGSTRDRAMTTTSATGGYVSIARDTLGEGYFNQTETIATAANGNVVDTLSNYAANGALLNRTVTTTAANGLTQTAQTDLNGDGVFDSTTSSTTAYGADGSKTISTTESSGTTPTRKTVSVEAGNGLSATTLVYNGAGVVLDERIDATALNADGSTQRTATDFSGNGTAIDRTTTIVSSDRMTTTIYSDDQGASAWTEIEQIAEQQDGSVMDVTTSYSTSGAKIAQTVKTTAANGLSWTLNQDENGDGVVDNTQTDTKVLNSDGSTTETYTDANGALNSTSDGYSCSTNVVTTTSANGLHTTVVTTGNVVYLLADNNTLTDDTVINPDGSTTETKSISGLFHDPNTGVTSVQPWDSETIATSANGLSKTTQLREADGNGAYPSYYQVTDSAAVLTDGSQNDTRTVLNFDGSLFEKDVTAISANGQSSTLQSARNGSSAFNHFETIVTNADGSVTDTVWNTISSGWMTDAVVTGTSGNGLNKAIYIEAGGAVIVEIVNDVTTLNADGSSVITQWASGAAGGLIHKETKTTSADGLTVTTTYDVNGDGVVDETTSDVTSLNADGSKSETATTSYAAGGVKSTSGATTSANGLNINTWTNLTGYGGVNDILMVSSSGVKSEGVIYTNASGAMVTSTQTTTSADGRNVVADHYNSSGLLTSVEKTLTQAEAYGSYQWTETDAYGHFLAALNHVIDANGVDSVLVEIGRNSPFNVVMPLDVEKEEVAAVKRLYATLLNREANSLESQLWMQYYSESGMNWTALINSILSSSEFTQRYGSLTNAQFVEQIYQNALGRSASVGELSNCLNEMNSGAPRASLVYAISENSEHVADGNVYQVTNNTYNNSGAYTRDHSVDSAAVGAAINNLYQTALDRQADANGRTSFSSVILNGSQTYAQVAATLIGSSEFSSKFGSLSNAQFVNQMFIDALNRAPTGAESQFWTGELNATAISRPDLVVGLAMSPGH